MSLGTALTSAFLNLAFKLFMVTAVLWHPDTRWLCLKTSSACWDQAVGMWLLQRAVAALRALLLLLQVQLATSSVCSLCHCYWPTA